MSNPYTLNVLVNGKSVTKYDHKDGVFIEGRKGSNFELEFKNNTNGRVLVIPSVDGLSTLNGEVATPESPGYVVAAYGILSIKGWTVDINNVAQFVFQDKERSYTYSNAGTSTNAGVVGVIVYKEKVEEPPKVIHQYVPYPVYQTQPWLIGTPYNGTPRDIWNISSTADNVLPGGNLTGDAVTPRRIQANNITGANAGLNMMATMNASMGGATLQGFENVPGDLVGKGLNDATEASFDMGTGWGDKIEQKTRSTTFNRGDLADQLVVFYDSRRNLEKRGIEVVKRERTQLQELPQAFTGFGCKPPAGWQG